MMRRQVMRLGLALLCLLTVLPGAAAAVNVVGTNATLSWSPASGPVVVGLGGNGTGIVVVQSKARKYANGWKARHP